MKDQKAPTPRKCPITSAILCIMQVMLLVSGLRSAMPQFDELEEAKEAESCASHIRAPAIYDGELWSRRGFPMITSQQCVSFASTLQMSQKRPARGLSRPSKAESTC
jgi:hypothetical protein